MLYLINTMKGRIFATIEEINSASLEELKDLPKSAYQKCRRPLYLRGITLKEATSTLMDKYIFFHKNIKSPYNLNTTRIKNILHTQSNERWSVGANVVKLRVILNINKQKLLHLKHIVGGRKHQLVQKTINARIGRKR